MAQRVLRNRTLPELMRALEDRLTRLERRSSLTVGTPPNGYVLEVDAAGNLVARHGSTGTTTVIASP